MKLTRRTVAGAVVGAPLWLSALSAGRLGPLFGIGEARADQPSPAPTPEPPPDDTALGRFLAKEEGGLTSEERRSVRKQVAQLEQSLKEIREFKLSNDVPPSGTFKALRTRRSHDR